MLCHPIASLILGLRDYSLPHHILRKTKAIAVLLLITITPSVSQNIQWEKIGGAYGGHINAVSSSKNGLVFAGTKGYGIYASSDRGKSWTDIVFYDFANCSITDLAVSRSGEIYAINVSRFSLYKSSTDGETWIKVSEFNGQSPPWCVAVDSLGNIYVGTYGEGVYISTDGGKEWTQAHDLKGFWIESIDVAPDGSIYAGADRGLYRSANYGLTWEPATITAYWVYGTAFKGTTDVFAAAMSGLYRSTDNGKGWKYVPGLAGCTAVTITPEGSILVGTTNGIARSTDDGTTWTMNDADKNNFWIEELGITIDGRILAATQVYGIYASEDDGQSWLPSSGSLETTTVYSLVETSSGNYLVGTTESLFLSTDDGQTWSRTGPASKNISIVSVRVSPNGTLFAGAGNGGVLRSRDDGQTWGWVNSGLPWRSSSSGMLYTAFSLEIDANGNLFIGSGGSDPSQSSGGVYRSRDEGESWVRVNSTQAQVMAFAPNVNGVIVFVTGSGAFRSTNEGSSWEFLQNTLGLQFFALTSSRKGHIFGAGFSYSSGKFDIFRSTDLGTSWEPLIKGAFYTPPIYAVITTPEGHIIAGGLGGIQISADDGKTWKNVSQGLPVNSNNAFAIQSLCKDSRGYLYAGSDKGIYRSTQPITSVPEPEISLPNTFTLNQNYPNPFNSTTAIRYSIPAASDVSLVVYDVLGRPVARLVSERKSAGEYQVQFDASNLPSGIYFYRIDAGNFPQTRKIVLLK